MSEENQKKSKEENKSSWSFNNIFSLALNIVALCIIALAIWYFYDQNKNKIKCPTVEPKIIPIEYSINLTDTTNTGLKSLIKDLEKQVNDLIKVKDKVEKEKTIRNEDFKYYGTLIGLIFAIVGFFGFKSIHDTRQSAIERAVFDAKEVAERKSKDVAEQHAKKTAELIALKETPILVKRETELYLDINLQSHYKKIEDNVILGFSSDIEQIKKDIDILKNPGKFDEDTRPQIFNKISIQFEKINERLEKYKDELESFKTGEFKKNIINELKKRAK